MLGRGPGELLVEAAVVPGPEGEVLAEADETVLDTAPPAHLGHLVRAGERQPPGGEKHFTLLRRTWSGHNGNPVYRVIRRIEAKQVKCKRFRCIYSKSLERYLGHT